MTTDSDSARVRVLEDALREALHQLASAAPADAAVTLEAALDTTRTDFVPWSVEARVVAAVHALATEVYGLPRTAADCQALLGAMELAERLGVPPSALAPLDAGELGRTIALLSLGPVQ